VAETKPKVEFLSEEGRPVHLKSCQMRIKLRVSSACM